MANAFKLPYLPELAGTFLLPLVIVLLCLPLRDWISPTDVAMLQLLWVAWQAQQYGWRWATLTTFVSVLILNWCFVPPYYTFDVHDASFLISFVVMVLLGLLISLLSDRSKQQVKRLRYAMSQTRGMYMLAKGLGQRPDWQKQCAYTAKLLSRRLGTAVQVIQGPEPKTVADHAFKLAGSGHRTEQAADGTPSGTVVYAAVAKTGHHRSVTDLEAKPDPAPPAPGPARRP